MSDFNDVLHDIREGVHDIQQGHTAEGLHDVYEGLGDALRYDLGRYTEGVQDLREGVHDLIIGNHEGVRDIAEGLHDLLIRTEGTPFHEGLQDLNEGFHDLTVASNPEGYRDIYEGLHDLAAALRHSDWAWRSERGDRPTGRSPTPTESFAARLEPRRHLEARLSRDRMAQRFRSPDGILFLDHGVEPCRQMGVPSSTGVSGRCPPSCIETVQNLGGE